MAELLRNVKGTNRRQMIRDYWEAGKMEELSNSYLAETLDDDQRRRLGQIRPSFMGGEYLPAYGPGEVEIARIELKSTTSDVISVRSRPEGDKIVYSIRDEYDTEFEVSPPSSKQPLSLHKLIGLIDRAGSDESLGIEFTLMNYPVEEYADDLEQVEAFTSVESTFYEQLTLHYGMLVHQWYTTRKRLTG